jgi:corrinoid protein of di/trimethylamine methyltransferase
MSLETLCRAVESGNREETEVLAQKLLEEGLDPLDAISALTETMNKVGDKFSRLEIFLPEMMMVGEAMTTAVNILRPKLLESGGETTLKGKVVLGVAKGDLHEIGKNVVKILLESAGFEVKDLGYDVDSLTFINEAKTMEADFIGVSSLMTTTMPGQMEIIDLLKDMGLREKHKVVIGGAPTSQEWADHIGADLYCVDAYSAPQLMEKLLKSV